MELTSAERDLLLNALDRHMSRLERDYEWAERQMARGVTHDRFGAEYAANSAKLHEQLHVASRLFERLLSA